MAGDNEIVFDGSDDFLGGQDASKVPDKIPANAYAAGVNVTTESGILSPRWGFEKLNITFPEGGVPGYTGQPKSFEDIFDSGIFQMIAPYAIGSENYLLIVISGVIFLLNLRTMVTQIITLDDETTLNPLAPRLNWTPAGKYLVIFDFPAYPVILDGIIARRADPDVDEIPVTNIGGFNQNRLFVGNAGNDFTAGDPVGVGFPTAPISFTEVLTIASPFFGQFFQLNTNYNNDAISAIAFLQTIDTSTGIGPLLVATPNVIYSYLTQNPRTAWEGQPFGSLTVYNAGIAGPRAFTNLNSDLIFLSGDGEVRSLSMSRDEQGKWSKIPMSREVKNWLKYWDKRLVRFGFVNYYKNKVFIGANPYRMRAFDNNNFLRTDYAHGGMVVLELDNMSSLFQDSKPSWAGLWTGVNPMDMAISGENCFIMSKDSFINTLYFMNPEITYDTADSAVRYVRSRVYFREYGYGNGFQNKEALALELNLEQMKGDVKLDTAYKPSHSSKFLPWRSFTHIAPWRSCTIPTSEEVNGFSGQQILNFNLGSPGDADACNPVGKEYYRIFRKIQPRLTIEAAYWELHELSIRAVIKPKNPTESICEPIPPVVTGEQCNDDWFVPEFKGCHQQQVT